MRILTPIHDETFPKMLPDGFFIIYSLLPATKKTKIK